MVADVYDFSRMGTLTGRFKTPTNKMQIKMARIDFPIYGGPYRDKPKTGGMKGIKMAEEIMRPCYISIPTRDFSVPDVAVFRKGLIRAIALLAARKRLYVGCFGGIGRTGLFLAALTKVMLAVQGSTEDPIQYVRKHFNPRAVETDMQREYIAKLDVSAIAGWVRCL